jgi:hypothetical protein
MDVTASKTHQQRKLEAKIQKRQLIEQSGGIRPRSSTKIDATIRSNQDRNTAETNSSSYASTSVKDKRRDQSSVAPTKHRFGRVMEHVPCRKIPRYSTVSIAVPSSILYNCQTRELKTIICGQIARAATIYHVDEIIIYNDGTAKSNDSNHFGRTHGFGHNRNKRQRDDSKYEKDATTKGDTSMPNATVTAEPAQTTTSDPQVFMARILQYCECPQYLRKHFFPIHSDLQFTGLLAPIDAPHHVRADDRCKYREGVVLQHHSSSTNSLVNCGIRNRPVMLVPILKY